MLHSAGFSCCVVNARHPTKVLINRDSVVEARDWRIASASLALRDAPPEEAMNPPMTISLYIERDVLQHSSWPSSRISSHDCMVYIFANGKRLLGPCPLSALERQPALLPTGKSGFHKGNALHGSQATANGWPWKQHNYMIQGETDDIPLSQLEVIVTPRWTEPIPLLRAEQYALSNHLAYFRFYSLPTQTINVSEISILPRDFWVHERELSANWEPFKRKMPAEIPPASMDNRAQYQAEPMIGPGLMDWQWQWNDRY